MSIEFVNSAIKWKETISKLTLSSTKIPSVKNLINSSTPTVAEISSDNLKTIAEENIKTTTTSSTTKATTIITNKIINIYNNKENDKEIVSDQENENDTNCKISDLLKRDSSENETSIRKCKNFNENHKNDNDKGIGGFKINNNCMMLDSSSSPERSHSLPPIPGLIPIRKANNFGNCNTNKKDCSSPSLLITTIKEDLNNLNDNKNIVEEQKDIDEDGFAVNKIYVEKLTKDEYLNKINKNTKNVKDDDDEKSNQNKISIKKTIIKRNNNNTNKKTKFGSENNRKGVIKNRKNNKLHDEYQQQQQQIRLKISSKQQSEIQENLNTKTMNSMSSLKNIKQEKMLVSDIETVSNNIESKNTIEISNPITPIMPKLIEDNQIDKTNTVGIDDLIKCNPKQKKRGRRPKCEMKALENQQQQAVDANQPPVNTATSVSENSSVVDASQPPIVQHRKSDRRRMPRDIFFFFEQPRSNRKGKANKNKRTVNRGNTKNNMNNINKTVQLLSSSPTSALSLPPPATSTSLTSSSSSSSPPPPPPPPSQKQNQIFQDTSIPNTTKKLSKFPIKNMKKETPNDVENTNNCVPKVNPIFLWVKQDHTRIIEVRCEDYDKRNRIRLTKTASGWRAMPRTDPTTSRVAKLLPNPLVRIKPEFQRSNLLEANQNDKLKNNAQNNNILTQSQEIQKQQEQQLKEQPRLKVRSYPPFENSIKKMKQHKNKKKKKKKKRKHDDNKTEKINNTLDEDPAKTLLENEEIRELLSDEPKDVIVYESINHEQVEDDITSPTTSLSQSQPEPPLPPPLPQQLQEIRLIEKPTDNHSIQIASSLTSIEPNNNSMTPNCTATVKSKITSDNLVHEIENVVGLNSMQFMQNLQNNDLGSQQTILCPSPQQTVNIFNQTNNSQQQLNGIGVNTITTSHHLSTDHVDLTIDTFDPNDVVCNDVNTKQLKDLLDDPELLQHCGDNGMNGITGEELIDSLMKRGCEDNDIATVIEDDDEICMKPSQHKQEKQNFNDDQEFQQHTCSNITKDINSIVPTTTICLDDFDNEEDDLLMQPEPVEDIISRLGESLTDSPKCLSFNEAGEIEGLHGELFQTSNQSISFNPTTTLEELSITIKDLEKSESLNTQPTATEHVCEPSLVTTVTTAESTTKLVTTTVTSTVSTPALTANTTTMVSPDSCVVDELPKDLTCKKSNYIDSNKSSTTVNQTLNSLTDSQQPERVLSRSSDAIQSPQPSGLPAVPPSPDLIHSKSVSATTATHKTVFMNQMSRQETSSPKVVSSTPSAKSIPSPAINSTSKTTTVQQKEPLDLGKHRKSASPTITCSEEANKNRLNNNIITIDDDNENIDCEPLEKRIKMENLTAAEEKNHTANLIEMLSCGKDPDPLTQLRLLINNSEWKVPDPILVPKDRLSAVLMSPAREIPLLLTTRPELRLPEAFAYPSILQDPDILVISLAQLETILQKHIELMNKTKSIPNIPQVTIEPVPRTRTEKSKAEELKTKKIQEAALNRHLLNPLAARLASNCLANEIDTATLAAFNQMLWLPYLGQMAPELFKAMVGFSKPNNLADMFSLLNQQQQIQQQQQAQSQMQQQKQQHQQQQQHQHQQQTNISSPGIPFQNPLEIAMWQEALNQIQLQRSLGLNGVSASMGNQQREQQKKNEDFKANANNMNLNLAALFNQKAIHEIQKSQQQQNQAKTSAAVARAVNEMNQAKKIQQNHTQSKQNSSDRNVNNIQHRSIFSKQKQQMHHNQQLHSQYNNNIEQKPRVTCKSLSNLLQPERLMDNNTTNSSLIDNKMSNLMAMPSFDFSSSGSLHHHQRAQQSLHQLQAAALSQQLNSQSLHHSSQFNTNHLATAAATAAAVNNDAVGYNSGFMNTNYFTNNSVSGTASNYHHQHNQTQQHQNKVKTKASAHLLDSTNAAQRRLMNCDDVTEIGNTNDELMNDPTAHLWHPLFGSHQKSSYNSPWQWTTVTATGE